MTLLKKKMRTILSCTDPVIWFFRVISILFVAALVVNAIQAIIGSARLAYWHYFSLAFVWYLGCWDVEFDEDGIIGERTDSLSR